MEILILDFTTSHLLVPQGWAGSWVPLLIMALIRWLRQQKEVGGARLATVCECVGGYFPGDGDPAHQQYPFSPLPRIPSLSSVRPGRCWWLDPVPGLCTVVKPLASALGVQTQAGRQEVKVG